MTLTLGVLRSLGVDAYLSGGNMTTKRIHVATFNTYNLVLPDITFYETKKYSKAQYAAKKAWIERQIEQMHPDIIGFQEVFHKAALTEILAEIPGLAQAELYMPAETGTNPCVALASRFPLENRSIIEEFPASAQLYNHPLQRRSRHLRHPNFQLQRQ